MRVLPGAWTARPPRVGILVPVDESTAGQPVAWREIVRAAWLHTTSFWGGAAAVVVPISENRVNRHVLAALGEYDPDYLVAYALNKPTGRSLDLDWLPREAVQQLRQHLSAIGPWDEHMAPFAARIGMEPDYPLTSITSLPSGEAEAHAGVASNDADLLVAVAAHHGWPPAPASEESSIAVLAAWHSLGAQSWLPQGRPTPLQRTTTGLQWLTAGVRRPAHPYLVAGSSAEDHCLAMIIDRLYGPGNAWWLPVHDDAQTVPQVLLSTAAEWASDRVRRAAAPLVVTSLTLSLEELGHVTEQLAAATSPVIVNGGPEPYIKHRPAVVAPEDLRLAAPRAQLVDGHRIHEPVQLFFDDDGRPAGPPPVPPIPRIAAAGAHRDFRWVVDLQVDGLSVPPRSVLNERHDGSGFVPIVRAGQHGWCWEAVSAFIGGADVAPMHDLNRMRVTEPDLREVVAALAAGARLSVEDSNVSAFYNRAVSAWGSIEQFADTLRDEARMQILRLLQGQGSLGTNCKNLARPAVRLSDMRRETKYGLSREEVRRLIEEWMQAGIARRGFGLKCGTCRFAAFYPVDGVGETWLCERCRTRQDLAGGWPLPHAEPPFMYVIDETVGQALDHHIEVPVLALNRAQKASRRGFRQALGMAITHDGVEMTDIDYAYLDGHELVLGEAKSNDKVASKEVETLVRIASDLTADRVEFTTTRPVWSTRSREAIAGHASIWRPRVESLTAADLEA